MSKPEKGLWQGSLRFSLALGGPGLILLRLDDLLTDLHRLSGHRRRDPVRRILAGHGQDALRIKAPTPATPQWRSGPGEWNSSGGGPGCLCPAGRRSMIRVVRRSRRQGAEGPPPDAPPVLPSLPGLP